MTTFCPDFQHAAVHQIIASDLIQKGYSLVPNGLPQALAEDLLAALKSMPANTFEPAGIGRAQSHEQNLRIRRDEICWIDGHTPAGQAWLAWANALQTYLNRTLFLGLFSFESHFAHYPPGAFYKRHVDAFKGQANRVLSLVVYLNKNWRAANGGQLVIYPDTQPAAAEPLATVTPEFATVVAFLSEDFPHEVLPANCDRYSIAGWFRVNTSSTDRVDPPK